MKTPPQRGEAEIALRKREGFPNPTVGVLFDREFTGERFVGGRLSIPLPMFNRNQRELESLEARRIRRARGVSGPGSSGLVSSA